MTYEKLKAEEVFSVTTAAALGTNQRGVVSDIDGVPLMEFSEIQVAIAVTQYPTGGTLDIYLQRPVVVTPVAATDAHWDDYMALNFGAVGTNIFVMPGKAYGAVTGGAVAGQKWSRAHTSLADGVLRVGDFGEQLRLVDKIGVAAPQGAIYTVTFRGTRKDV